MKKIILTITAFCILSNAEAQLINLPAGSVAPDFSVTDLHGTVHTRAEFAGKYLLVDMFFTTCVPCQGVSPIINEFYTKYGCNAYDIQVMAVETSTDNADTEAYESSYGGDQNHLTPTVSGTEGGGITFKSSYNANSFPTIFLVGPDGLIKSNDIWPVSSVSDLENVIIAVGGTSSLVAHTCITSGIEEITLSSSKLYPNPSNGIINYEFDADKSEALTIHVIDIVGKIVFKKEYKSTNGLNKLNFNFSELESGNYLFKIINSEGKSSVQPFQIK